MAADHLTTGMGTGSRPATRRRRAALVAGTAVVALALALVGLGSGAVAATLLNDDFEDGNANGWTPSGGSWSVVSDGSQVLRQSSTSSDARSLAGSLSWTNVTVQVRAKALSFNGSDRFFALLARVQSATSYYYLAVRSSNRVELKKLAGGSSTLLASAPLSVTTGVFSTLRLEVAGTQLRGFVDGAQLVAAADGQFSAGGVGVATFNASAEFDDVAVSDAAPPATTTPTSTTSPATTTSTPTSTTGPVQQPAGLVGFASLNALGQNGTTGGAGGQVVTASTSEQFLDFIDTIGPLIIRVEGTIGITSKQGVRPNKTIIGVGTTAEITGGGLDFHRSSNVIVRNLRFTNAEDDAINVGQNSHHIWIDHNDLSGAADGAVDIVRGADYVTVSWNHFHDHSKTILVGHSDSNGPEDTGHLRVTFHHNFFDGTEQRHPRVRFGEPVHVYNNYFLNNGMYGVASTMDAGVLVEGNYFENVASPVLVGFAESGPGRVVERNNVYVGSGTPQTLGMVVEPRTFYDYAVDSPASVPTIVRNGAGVGRISG